MSGTRHSRFSILGRLVRAELGAGLAGLKLFIAAVALGTAMLALVWMIGGGAGDAFERNGRAIVGGDVELEVPTVRLDPGTLAAMEALGQVSVVADMRSTVRLDDRNAPVELRGVDELYPLYGTVRAPQGDIQDLLAARDGTYGAVGEQTLFDRLDANVGDMVVLGDIVVELRGVLTAEPDRLGVGAFMVGPRLLISDDALEAAHLVTFGSLVDFRYRVAFPEGANVAASMFEIRKLEPSTGWRVRTPANVSNRVRQGVERTTTFMGIAGVAAMAVAISGAWAASGAWVRKRGRTISLYRLSGANRGTVAALHGVILMAAALVATLIGLVLAAIPAWLILDFLALALPVTGVFELLPTVGAAALGVMLLGVLGAAVPAISAAARVPAGAAMRGGEPPAARAGWLVIVGLLLIVGAMALSVLRLPDPRIGGIAAAGLAAFAVALWILGRVVALVAGWLRPRGFVLAAAMRALADPQAAAAKTVAIGIGIAAIVAVDAVSAALDARLQSDLPRRLPGLILVDVQPEQRLVLNDMLAETDGLTDVDLQANLRGAITQVNGVPAREALVDFSERWVITGDHGVSWTAEPLPGGVWSGGYWWEEDYDGPMLLSISDDVAEAFAIGPGDQVTFAVLGRELTGEVANVRNVRWQALGSNFIIVASPQPLMTAPHTWHAQIEGSDAAIDSLIERVNDAFANVTVIDVRTLLRQLEELVGGTATAAFAVAMALLAAGGIALAAVIAADADARAREGLAYALVGASRLRIAVARLGEVAAIGVLAAALGGAAGLYGGDWLAERALRVAGVVTWQSALLPVLLGVVAAVAAGLAAGVVSMPRGRGSLISKLAT